MLPIANRFWVEYWIEGLVAQEVRELHLLLSDGAFEVEQALGDGARWGLALHYHFLRPGVDPATFLRRSPAQWDAGVLWIGGPCFPRRRDALPPAPLPTGPCVALCDGSPCVCLGRNGAEVEALLAGRPAGVPTFDPACMAPEPVGSLSAYFALNMALVKGECAFYLTPGYRREDQAYLGFNVVYPATARLTAPLLVGNDVRMRELSTVGPDAILGDRVILDRQATVTASMVLDGTYVGEGVELAGKIAVGRRLIDPEDGTTVDLDDLLLLAPLRHAGARGERLRRLAHRFIASLAFLAALPLAAPWLALDFLGGGRPARRRILGVRGPVEVRGWNPGRAAPGLMRRLSVHEWPLLLAVVRGDLWLCGQLPVTSEEESEAKSWPAYRPGLFTYADGRPGREDPVLRRIEAAYYAHHRGWREDLRIGWRGWWGRLTGRTRPIPASGEGEGTPA